MGIGDFFRRRRERESAVPDPMSAGGGPAPAEPVPWAQDLDTIGQQIPTAGSAMPLDLSQLGGSFLCQRDGFLCAAQGIDINVEFTKRIGAGLFGGEGFVMQRISGNGTAFIHASGTLAQISLRAGESLKVDTGCLAALQTSVTYDVMYVGKLKTSILGGEGLFLAKLMGPGTVWLQSLPMQRLRASLLGASVAQSRGPGARMAYLFGVIIFTLIVLSRLP